MCVLWDKAVSEDKKIRRKWVRARACVSKQQDKLLG